MSEQHCVNENCISVKTVGAEYGYADHISDDKKFQPMQIVFGKDIDGDSMSLGVVLMGPIDIPFFEDGVASEHAFKPLEITNPEEWRQTFRAYVVFDLSKQKYVICSYRELILLDEKHPHNSYVLHDTATAQMRVVQGLLKLAETNP